MAEWLYEAGIGEARAALVEDGRIVEAVIEPEGSGPLVDAVVAGRLDARLGNGQARAVLAGGEEVLVSGVGREVTEGMSLAVRITREPIVERGRCKPAHAIVTDDALREGADLLARIGAAGVPVRECRPHEPDRLEQAGWSEVLEEARAGTIGFAGGQLLMIPTPAMTLFDVDGAPPLEALAIAAAGAAGRAIRRHGIVGSIGIDFPTLAGKAPRQAVAAALDAVLEPPFERTAVNGFGFLQIVRPRLRASLPERLAADPAGATARALLRTLERAPPGRAQHVRVSRSVRSHLDAHAHWLAELARRTGVTHIIDSP